ncbi:MAG: DUF4382 domain-containing protein [Pseudomonadaceae bacterium]|nr:DUF4382 domain-containing protein [Pseudomonadaceae bacterium]
MRFSAVLFSLVLVLFGCGGGSSSSGNNSGAQGTAPPQFGGITLLVGDSPLDDIESVLIDIREIRLLGDDGQVTITDGPTGVIDLLSLRNLTELIASDEVPAGDYSKIRLLIDSLQIVEIDAPSTPVDVQLPANGKIDLNPQGEFEISPGEDLVVQIDFDLARSIKIVETGNSEYRFRPVVFVDILDQTENLRLTRLFGTLQADDDEADDEIEGEPSDYDLCTELNDDPCVDVETNEGTVFLDADGNAVDMQDFIVPQDVHVFGHYFIGVEGGEFFRAKLIVVAAEDGLTRRDGLVNSTVVDEAFELLDDSIAVNVQIGEALLLEEIGNALDIDIAPGQTAEAWALNTLLDIAEEGDFPAILVQIDDTNVEEDTIEGTLVDLESNTLTVRNDEGDFCVTIDEDTDIQLLSDYAGDAETDTISRVALGDLITAGVEVEAFGLQNGDCLEADLVAAEVED